MRNKLPPREMLVESRILPALPRKTPTHRINTGASTGWQEPQTEYISLRLQDRT